jgi:hypothetical protein
MDDKEFTGEELHQLVLDVEAAVGMNKAGCTPLGSAIVRLCEETYAKDKQATRLD